MDELASFCTLLRFYSLHLSSALSGYYRASEAAKVWACTTTGVSADLIQLQLKTVLRTQLEVNFG